MVVTRTGSLNFKSSQSPMVRISHSKDTLLQQHSSTPISGKHRGSASCSPSYKKLVFREKNHIPLPGRLENSYKWQGAVHCTRLQNSVNIGTCRPHTWVRNKNFSCTGESRKCWKRVPFLQCLILLSSVFLVGKKDGGNRPVINLRNQNKFVPYEHFKMEGLHCPKFLLQKWDYVQNRFEGCLFQRSITQRLKESCEVQMVRLTLPVAVFQSVFRLRSCTC